MSRPNLTSQTVLVVSSKMSSSPTRLLKDTPLTTLPQVASDNDGEGVFVVGDYATHLITNVALTRFQSSIKDAAHIQHRAS
jgi:hypothetical protein